MQNHRGAMSPFLVFAACVAVIAASSMPLKDAVKSTNTKESEQDYTKYLLDGNIRPSSYNIRIEPEFTDDETENFLGKVVISAHAHEETSTIILHKASNIKTTKEVVCRKSSESDCEENSLVKDVSSGPEDLEFLNINLKEPLKQEDIVIIIEYKAEYPDGMYGFYKSTYTFETESGNKREDFLLTTQFQPTHARKAFPCFDEPKYKATFTITLAVPEGYNALSNTEGRESESTTRDDASVKKRDIVFDITPIMSTYLVAFIIYKEESFHHTEDTTGSLPFKTWGRAAEIDSGLGALSQTDGPEIITKMEEYTNIKYTTKSKKIDQAAIPDFSAGAMENWGLITYRETALLYDESEHTQSAKKRASEVIAHELAHQWFGNLVTTEWWDSTWLNEGFATYFEYYITDLIHPAWRMMERFVIDEQLAALSADASLSASTLTKEVYTPDQIGNHFGTITYSKGGSVLRMFANTMGEEKFQNALQNYLTANAEGSVTPDILFEALSEEAGDVGLPEGSDLKEIFKSWTTEPGFPIIKVFRKDSKLVLSQKQFLADGTSLSSSYNYKVRLSLKSNDEDFSKDKKIWFLEKEASLDEEPEEGKWIFVPTDGYFRVNYDEDNWELLIEELRNITSNDLESVITPLERAVLIDNALNFARTGILEYSVAIDLLSYLENELDYVPWAVALSGLNYMHRMLWKEGDTMEKFVLHIISNVYDSLEFKEENNINDEKHIEHVHRANILNWACRVGHEKCIQQAAEYLENYLEADKSVKVAPDLRSVVYCYGVKNDERLWTKLWRKLEETDDASERALIISALGCSTNPSTLYMYLQRTVLDGAVRIQDILSVFTAVNSNPEGVDVSLEFLEFKLSKIEERTETLLNGLSRILTGTAQYIKTNQQKEQFEEIAKKISNSVAKEDAENALKSAESNFKWLEKKYEVIAELEKALEEKPVPTPAPGAAWMGRPAALSLAFSVILPTLAFLL